MSKNNKAYYGHCTESELLNLMAKSDNGAFFEIMYRFYRPLSTAISEILLEKITDREPLDEYVDCVILAEHCADKITHSTMVLMWNNREFSSEPSIYLNILDMLKLQLDYDTETKFLPYSKYLEIKALSYMLLQPAQIKRNKELQDRLEDWTKSESDINADVFDSKFIAGLNINQISNTFDLTVPEIEAQLQIIQRKFEEHLQNHRNRMV